MLEKIIKNKMFPFLVVILVLGLILAIVILLNANKDVNDKKLSEGISSQESASETSTPTKKKLSFGAIDGVEQVGNTSAISPYINFGDSEIIFLNKDYHYTSNKGLIQGSETFLPDSTYILPENKILINQPFRSYIYDSKTGIAETLPETIFSIAPEYDTSNQIVGYFFLQNKNDKIFVKKSTDLTFAGVQTLTSVEKAKLASMDQIELRVLAGKSYLFEYKLFARQRYEDSLVNPVAQKNLSIYSTDPEPVLKFYLPELQSIQFSKNYLLYTTILSNPNNLTNLEQNIIDFRDSKLNPNSLDFTDAILARNASGKILADRCSFREDEQKLICLVKESKSSTFDPDAKDLFMEYDIDKISVEFLFESLNVAGQSIHYSPTNEIYIIGQGNNNIYKINGK
jgi:hypothetical protein